MKEKSTENVIQAHLSGILAHEGRSVVILSDNGIEFKNKVLNETYNQLGIKRLFSNLFHPQGNAIVENVHNFLKWTLTKFLKHIVLECDKLLPLTCYCYNIFPGSNSTESPFFLMFEEDPLEGHLTHLNKSNKYYGTCKGKIISKELHKLWKHDALHLTGLCQ